MLAGRQALRSNATRNLHRLQSFLVSLVNPDRDGRILLSAERVSGVAASNGSAARPERIEVTMKYLLLAPSDSFRDVAQEARSVVLAGGTMAPVRSLAPSADRNLTAASQISDFREQLFPYLSPLRFSTFSCGHIVPPDHVGTYAISKGPTGVPLQFTFDKRKDEKLVSRLLEWAKLEADLAEAGRTRQLDRQHLPACTERRRRFRAFVRFPRRDAGSLAEVRDARADSEEEGGAWWSSVSRSDADSLVHLDVLGTQSQCGCRIDLARILGSERGHSPGPPPRT